MATPVLARDSAARNDERRELARNKLTWLERCLVLSPGAVKLAVLIATVYLNRHTGWAWPAQGTLAKRLGVSVRQVRRYLDELAGAGLLEIERGERNRYRPADDRTPMSGSAADDRTPMSDQSGHSRPVRTGHQSPPIENPLESNPLEEPARGARSRRPRGGNGFEDFWRQYPNQIGEDGARREYGILIRNERATPAELLAAAMRYAHATDARYAMNPSRWLRDGRWRDPTPTTPQMTNGSASAVAARREGIMNFVQRHTDPERQAS